MYETSRDILLSKKNATLSNSVVSQYDYTVNPIGQRTSRAQTGTYDNVRNLAQIGMAMNLARGLDK